jgi:hypothetical protein
VTTPTSEALNPRSLLPRIVDKELWTDYIEMLWGPTPDKTLWAMNNQWVGPKPNAQALRSAAYDTLKAKPVCTVSREATVRALKRAITKTRLRLRRSTRRQAFGTACTLSTRGWLLLLLFATEMGEVGVLGLKSPHAP